MISFRLTSACSNNDLINDLVFQISSSLQITTYSFQNIPDVSNCIYEVKWPDFYVTHDLVVTFVHVLTHLPFTVLLWLILHLFYSLIPGSGD